MATPPGLSPLPSNGEQSATDDASDTHLDDAPSSSPEPLRSTPDACPWRTPEYCHQECTRYFDCPSHVLERRDEAAPDGREPSPSRGSSAATTGASDDASYASRHPLGESEMSAAQHTGDALYHFDAAGSDLVETSPTSPRVLSGSAPIDRGTGSFPPRTSSAMQGNVIAQRPSSSRRSQSHDTPSALADPSRMRYVAALPPSAADQYRASTPRTGRNGSDFRLDQRFDGDGRVRPRTREQATDGSSTECLLPRWQPDAEVTYCPICHTQFSIFVRKHHCRKCGRVVCNACSPHRIIIPHPYIVRPPGSEFSMPSSLLLGGLGAGYVEANGPSGGERVRLCNPCVPDPNTAPPQSPVASAAVSPRAPHQRTRSNQGSAYGLAHASSSSFTAPFPAGRSGDAYQYYSPRWRSATMTPAAHGGPTGTGSHQVRISATYHPPLERYLALESPSAATTPRRNRHSSFGEASSSSRHRALQPPPPPQIAEEDECPICHQELPSRELPDVDTLRESHVSLCIQAHSTYGSPRGGGGGESAPHMAPRRTGMYTYAATEKDCIDDAECTICLEEFTVGVAMARLECLCRFHKACISAWFVNHPGRCPVHQHDGFGF